MLIIIFYFSNNSTS